jgi:site-specific DNA-methyltransferase (adenine-specific)
MATFHKLIIGDCSNMHEIQDECIDLVLTSPPYFNAPFDYNDLFDSYSSYLNFLKNVAVEIYRVLKQGRVVVINIDDMLVNSEKFPIVADCTKIFQEVGLRYRDRIIWKKPEGYLRISKRSGILLQHPYPMYYYPDNLLESILIFQKGKFDYKSISKDKKEASIINKKEFLNNKWYMSLWEMTNVLPNSDLEKGIAAFPEELAYRIIKLFSYVDDIVLDPFVGSGTTMKVARLLGRNSIGIEIKKELISIIKEKIGFGKQKILQSEHDSFEIIIRKQFEHESVC